MIYTPKDQKSLSVLLFNPDGGVPCVTAAVTHANSGVTIQLEKNKWVSSQSNTKIIDLNVIKNKYKQIQIKGQ